MAIKEEFYDKKGTLKKIKTVDIQKMDKYWVPILMSMENIKSKHKTKMEFSEINLDTGLEEKIFKSNYMKRIH
jgi:outer membrane lipoprotein-sorting protein